MYIYEYIYISSNDLIYRNADSPTNSEFSQINHIPQE